MQGRLLRLWLHWTPYSGCMNFTAAGSLTQCASLCQVKNMSMWVLICTKEQGGVVWFLWAKGTVRLYIQYEDAAAMPYHAELYKNVLRVAIQVWWMPSTLDCKWKAGKNEDHYSCRQKDGSGRNSLNYALVKAQLKKSHSDLVQLLQFFDRRVGSKVSVQT